MVFIMVFLVFIFPPQSLISLDFSSLYFLSSVKFCRNDSFHIFDDCHFEGGTTEKSAVYVKRFLPDFRRDRLSLVPRSIGMTMIPLSSLVRNDNDCHSDPYESRERNLILFSSCPIMYLIALFHPQSHIHQTNQHRHFNQRTNHPGKSLWRIQSEYGNGYGNRQFKIVSGRRKRD